MVNINIINREGLDDMIIFERINNNIVRLQIRSTYISQETKNINSKLIITNSELGIEKEILGNLNKWMTNNKIKFKEKLKLDRWLYLKTCDN